MNCWRTVAIIILVGSTFAQTQGVKTDIPTKAETIWIGTDLQLGMAKDTVMSQLTGYRVVKVQVGDDDWFVTDGQNPPTVYGNLGFTNRKLTYAARTWTPREVTDGFSLAQALHGVLTEFRNENKHHCYMDTGSTRTPDDELKKISLSCGAKRLDISITEVFSGAAKGRYVDVHEVLSSEKDR